MAGLRQHSPALPPPISVRLLLDLTRLAFKSLTERRTRALLTIIGIAIGPMALVSIVGVVKGYSDYVISQVESIGQNLILVFPSSDYHLTDEDLDYFRSLPGVARAEPFYMVSGYVSRGSEAVRVQVFAMPADAFFEAIKSVRIMKGDIPLPSEVTKAVVGYYVAYDEEGNNYYDVGDTVTIRLAEVEPGGKVKERRINIAVKAVLEEFGGAIALVNPDKTIILPLDAGPRLLKRNEWAGVFIIAESPEYVKNITLMIRDAYGDKVDVISLLAIANIASSITAAMNFVTFAASLSAFAVAVTGVAATMITSVIERTREIGVLKALGFTNTHVLALILLESVLMSLIGAAIGVVIGVAGAYALSQRGMVIRGVATAITIKAQPEITPAMVTQVVVLTTLVGVAGGAFPAYRAAKIPPAVALRHE